MHDAHDAITSFRDLIALWPSVAAFAVDIGCKPTTARQMKYRNNIDSVHWPQLVEAAKRRKLRGVTFDLLFHLQGQKKIVADKIDKAA